MKSKRLGLASAALVGACLSLGITPPAHADVVYDWSFDAGAGGQSGSGTLTTADQQDPSHVGGYDLTGITGVWSDIIYTGTFPITGLTSFVGADNIFYPAGPVFGLYGFSFSDSNNDLVNISTYCTSATGTRYCAVEYVPASGDGPSQMGDFTVTPASVPGPIAGAGIPGLIAAASGLMVWWRRRRKTA
jgi:hypothetical protein